MANGNFLRSGPSSWRDVAPEMLRAAVGRGLIPEPPPGREPPRWAGGYPCGNPYYLPHGGDYGHAAPGWGDEWGVPSLPPGFPRAFLATDRRPRLGIFSPGAYLGGAERHISDLLDHCDGSRVAFGGIAIQGRPSVPSIPSVLGDWQAHCPVGVGEPAMRALAGAIDVLVTWGFRSEHIARIIPAGLPVIEISHCAWAANQDQCSLDGSTVVAVAASALNGVPAGRRGTTRIIHNAVHADRVRPALDWAAQRAAWGVPAGGHVKVAGWLGRIAREKRPERYIDGIAKLPREWVGVMVGTGLQEAEARAYADRVCPGRVIFAGPTTDVGSALRAFDCFVMTSGAEGCCYALAEAWLAGIPTISCEVGLLEERPDLARLLPLDPTGHDVARAILADHGDRAGTLTRVGRAMRFARDELGMDKFGREWTDLICGVARPRERAAAHAARPAAYRPMVDPTVRDAVLACPDRGGSLTLLDEERTCCGGGPELNECRAGKGKRPGRVALADCLNCQAGKIKINA